MMYIVTKECYQFSYASNPSTNYTGAHLKVYELYTKGVYKHRCKLIYSNVIVRLLEKDIHCLSIDPGLVVLSAQEFSEVLQKFPEIIMDENKV